MGVEWLGPLFSLLARDRTILQLIIVIIDKGLTLFPHGTAIYLLWDYFVSLLLAECKENIPCSLPEGRWHIRPAKVTLSPAKTVKIAHFIAKSHPAAPIYPLQQIDIVIVGRLSHPMPPSSSGDAAGSF